MDKKFSSIDEYFMHEAIKEAKKALRKGEVPVGAVIVYNGQIVGRGYNLRESKKNPISHAEMIAIEKAAKKLKGWRLCNCTLYVTLEPCIMCFGAILNSRISRLVYGTENREEGFTQFVNIRDYKKWKDIEIISGIKKDVCESLLKEFFKDMRSSRS
ncbi:nucleoside deaminase [Dictyoglomus turgidum]|uniref:tRNA-specific adenosine deaminase n=2 Tax=Dictyoglomus TaxID=13 RepID=B8E307_DICTD|nr:CMP/dCMP deaminase zinc-binding [Dictyoglomus turgidum DSM 6724]HBU32288.1 nucleoside deaminase [Dictyoglomus sp.]